MSETEQDVQMSHTDTPWYRHKGLVAVIAVVLLIQVAQFIGVAWLVNRSLNEDTPRGFSWHTSEFNPTPEELEVWRQSRVGDLGGAITDGGESTDDPSEFHS